MYKGKRSAAPSLLYWDLPVHMPVGEAKAKGSALADSHSISCSHAVVISSSGSLVVATAIWTYAAPVLFAFLSLSREEEEEDTFAYCVSPPEMEIAADLPSNCVTNNNSGHYVLPPPFLYLPLNTSLFSSYTHLPTEPLIMLYSVLGGSSSSSSFGQEEQKSSTLHKFLYIVSPS